MSKNKIKFYAKIGALSTLIMVGAVKFHNNNYDHASKVCFQTKILCSLLGDEKGSKHQQREIEKMGNTVEYYKFPEDSTFTNIMPANQEISIDSDGTLTRFYSAPGGFTLNGDLCTQKTDVSNQSVLIVNDENGIQKILKLHSN